MSEGMRDRCSKWNTLRNEKLGNSGKPYPTYARRGPLTLSFLFVIMTVVGPTPKKAAGVTSQQEVSREAAPRFHSERVVVAGE